VLQFRRDSKLSLHEKLASETAPIGAQHSTILGIIGVPPVAKIRYIDVVAARSLKKAKPMRCRGKYHLLLCLFFFIYFF